MFGRVSVEETNHNDFVFETVATNLLNLTQCDTFFTADKIQLAGGGLPVSYQVSATLHSFGTELAPFSTNLSIVAFNLTGIVGVLGGVNFLFLTLKFLRLCRTFLA